MHVKDYNMHGNNFRKDCPPDETISKIRAILQENNITVTESSSFSSGDRLYSIRIELNNLPGCGSNGKGTSKQRALASAYAELMERLQNRYMSGFFERYGRMPQLEYTLDPPDQIIIPFHQYIKEYPTFMEWFIEPPLKKVAFSSLCKVVCLPYLDFEKQCTVYLPHAFQIDDVRLTLMSNRIGSTGMCAGNSFHEAVCQGLCEVLERFVKQKIFCGEHTTFPSISVDSFRGHQVYKLIEDANAKGLTTIVKDCTLDGCFPVIGLILIDSDNQGMLCIASDPVLEIALERCFTESFQGTHNSLYPKQRIQIDMANKQFKGAPFFNSDLNRVYQLILSIKNGSSFIPVELLLSNSLSDLPLGFANDVNKNSEALEFVVNRIHNAGGRIFIRDVSFLGFPSYHVFIAGMSNILLPRLTHEQLYSKYERMRGSKYFDCILKLDNASEQEIIKCAEALESEWTSAVGDPLQYEMMMSTPLFSWAARLILASDYDCSFLEEGDFLLSLLFHRAGNYSRAFQYLNTNLQRKGCDSGRRKYFLGVLAYFRLKEYRVNNLEIIDRLQNIVGKDLAKEITNDLGDRLLSFQYLTLPKCGDCSHCPINDVCCYESWRGIQHTIRNRLWKVKIDQSPTMTER